MLSEEDKEEIRRRAEERVRSDDPVPYNSPEEIVYELRVHQAQLEMQNEELLRSEHELQRSRREFETLFESAPIGYFVLNKEGGILDVNLYGANLLQADRKYLSRKPFIVFVPRESHAQFFHHLQRVFDEARLQSLEMPIIDRRGRRLWGRFESRLQTDESGNPRCFMAVIDVTDRKRVEDDLILAREDAVQASKAKSLFLANMSHEIRTPMNAVMAMAELTLETELDKEQREWVQVIRNSANELTRIIGDVLDFSRIEANKLTIESGPFDVSETLAAIETTFSSNAKEKALEFSITTEPGMHRWYRGDQYRVRQVLYNLVSNAIKFTDHGSVQIVARSQAISSTIHELTFEVRDTGIGIQESQTSSVFDSFYQADSGYAKPYQGTGLGLAISRRLARLMSGQLYFSSNDHSGTVFYFTLPLHLESEVLPPETETSRSEDTGSRPLRTNGVSNSGRILVAEDNSINVLVMRTLLERAGYDVTTATTGLEVLEHLKESLFDAALMDISMPELDGIEATRRIRAGEVLEENVTIPILAITAHSMAGDREQFIAAGMDDYLAKPFSKQAVLERVAKIIRIR